MRLANMLLLVGNWHAPCYPRDTFQYPHLTCHKGSLPAAIDTESKLAYGALMKAT